MCRHLVNDCGASLRIVRPHLGRTGIPVSLFPALLTVPPSIHPLLLSPLHTLTSPASLPGTHNLYTTLIPRRHLVNDRGAPLRIVRLLAMNVLRGRVHGYVGTISDELSTFGRAVHIWARQALGWGTNGEAHVLYSAQSFLILWS